MGKRGSVIYLIILFLTALLAYGRSLFNGFVWDDDTLIERNTFLSERGALWKSLYSDIYAKILHLPYYRPVVLASFVLDYKIWKLNPFGYRLTCLLLHLLNVYLLFKFLVAISGRENFSFFLTLLFACHPAPSEAVFWTSGRTDLLIFTFSVLALYFHFHNFKQTSTIWRELLSLFCILLAFLSKETAIGLIPLILSGDLLFRKDGGIKKLTYYLPYYAGSIIVLSVFKIARDYVLEYYHIRIPLLTLPFKQVILAMIKGLGFYLLMPIFPYFLCPDRHLKPPDSFYEPAVILTLSALLLLIFFVIFKSSREDKFFFLWFVFFIFPAIFFIAPQDHGRERYLYLPIVGILWIYLRLGERILIKLSSFDSKKYEFARNFYICLLILITVSYILRTAVQAGAWKNDISFLKDVIECCPDNSVFYFNLAFHYLESGYEQEAIENYQKSIELNPDFSRAYLHLGLIYFHKNKLDLAEQNLKKSLELWEFHEQAYIALAKIYELQGQKTKAIEQLDKLFEIGKKLENHKTIDYAQNEKIRLQKEN